MSFTKEGIRLGDLSKRVGLHNSTTFHLVKTMLLLGYLRQMPDKLYRVGRPLFTLAAGALDEVEMVALATPVLDELSAATQESCHFGIRSGRQVIVMARTAGTGPFQLTSCEHKVKLLFKQNPNWYGKKPTLTDVEMDMIADPNTAWNQFQSKEQDIGGPPAADYKIAKALGPKQFSESPYLAITYISPNNKVAPFDNVTVRQAFAYALDRKTGQPIASFGDWADGNSAAARRYESSASPFRCALSCTSPRNRLA